MTEYHEFICACCHEPFVTAWTDEEARAEFEAKFGREVREGDDVTVCDECYDALNATHDAYQRRARFN